MDREEAFCACRPVPVRFMGVCSRPISGGAFHLCWHARGSVQRKESSVPKRWRPWPVRFGLSAPSMCQGPTFLAAECPSFLTQTGAIPRKDKAFRAATIGAPGCGSGTSGSHLCRLKRLEGRAWRSSRMDFPQTGEPREHGWQPASIVLCRRWPAPVQGRLRARPESRGGPR